jgi:hypothetical protein
MPEIMRSDSINDEGVESGLDGQNQEREGK